MSTNNRKYKWFGGISVTTVIAGVLFYLTLVDRAATKIDQAVVTGEEKATHKAELVAVEKRVTDLEGESEKMTKVMYGEGLKDGMIQAVVELSGKVDNIEKQNDLILEEIKGLKK